jgi:predicted N-acyltransferase
VREDVGTMSRPPGRGEGAVAHVGLHPAWGRLAARGPVQASLFWLHVLGGRIPGETVTFVAFEDTEPAAGLLATVVETARPYEVFDLRHVVASPSPVLPFSRATQDAREGLAARAPEAGSWYPSLVAMLPGYVCPVVGPAADSDPPVEQLAARAVAFAEQRGLRTAAFLYVRPEEAALCRALHGLGFRRIPLAFTCELGLEEIAGGTFDGYLASLPKHRRSEVRRELRRMADAGIELRVREPGEVTEDLVRLRTELVRAYRGEADAEAERARLRALVEAVPSDRLPVFTAERDGEVLGFALFLTGPTDWHPIWTGAERRRPEARLTYFATAFYQPIAAALAAGARVIHYGMGSWQAKRARGCRLVPLDAFVLAFEPELDAVVRESAAVTALDPALAR